MVAEQLQHLPSPHPFEHYLHVCFAVQSTNTSFLKRKKVKSDHKHKICTNKKVDVPILLYFLFCSLFGSESLSIENNSPPTIAKTNCNYLNW